ncbi:hypothetical protein KFE25_005547 [Diacronema lutheri]|uniref:Uncharacterized protein n=2 Tax=Diacronema lutheri TaxID=2081491 RepID=A0A8J5XPR3_DIALT|nr:hypothetical protein KFE25_005547 [Diacronema lutheri]
MLNSARDSARAVRDAASRRLAASSLDAIAPGSTFTALLCIFLVGISLDGHEWLRGTSMHLGRPRDALVSLGAVRFGEPQANRGVRFAHPTALRKLCTDESAPLPYARVPASETDQAVWCQLARAGSRAQSFLLLGYLPLWVAATLSGVLWFSSSLGAAKSARYALAAAGLSDAALALALVVCWTSSWFFLFISLSCFAYAAPSSLGWGAVGLEASFGVLQLAFVIMTVALSALLAQLLSLWDAGSARGLWVTLLDMDNARKALALALSAQLLLLLGCALKQIEWQALVQLIGLHFVDTGKTDVLLAFFALTSLSLLVDVYRLGAMPAWAAMTGAQAFADGCYLLAALLKPVVLLATAVVWRRDSARRRVEENEADLPTPGREHRSTASPPFSSNF